jgi:hypothetical protein
LDIDENIDFEANKKPLFNFENEMCDDLSSTSSTSSKK